MPRGTSDGKHPADTVGLYPVQTPYPAGTPTTPLSCKAATSAGE